jgi:uncharacterized membrane protein
LKRWRPHGYYYAKHTFNHLVSDYQKQKKTNKINFKTINNSNKELTKKETIFMSILVLFLFIVVCWLCTSSITFGIIATLFGFLSGLWFLGLIFLICTFI